MEGLKDDFRGFYDAFPDFGIELDDIVADGDTTAVRLTFTGTHGGPFMGIPPTGKAFRVQSMNFVRFDQAGRPADRWGSADWLGLMQQLGLAP